MATGRLYDLVCCVNDRHCGWTADTVTWWRLSEAVQQILKTLCTQQTNFRLLTHLSLHAWPVWWDAAELLGVPSRATENFFFKVLVKECPASAEITWS